MWAAGCSASVIANELETRSRNAVMGRLWRLDGFKVRAKGMTPKPIIREAKPVTKPETPPEPIRPPPRELDASQPVLLVDLEIHHCRWPVSEPREMLFCGRPKEEDRPYCPHHTSKAYQRGR
jgi:hypothetical protein